MPLMDGRMFMGSSMDYNEYMHQVVCVKGVPASAAELELRDDGTLDDEWVTYELNEWDEYALEEAVSIREGVGGTVTALMVGDRAKEDLVFRSLAKGADRAVRVDGEGLDQADTFAKARVAAGAIDDMDDPPILVYTGLQAADTANAQFGGTVAATLDLPFTSFIVGVEYEDGADVLTVRRELEGGLEERRELEIPAVLGIQTGLNDPPYASIREIRAARDKPVVERSLDEFGLGPVAVTEMAMTGVNRYFEPEVEDAATVFEGDPDETANELAETLVELGVVR